MTTITSLLPTSCNRKDLMKYLPWAQWISNLFISSSNQLLRLGLGTKQLCTTKIISVQGEGIPQVQCQPVVGWVVLRISKYFSFYQKPITVG